MVSNERFWDIETITEGQVVRNVIKRRFLSSFTIISESLESADPIDIVYLDNPDEYGDVVLEVIVLLASVDGRLDSLSVKDLENVIRKGLARCFDEEPDDARVAQTVDLIRRRVASADI